MEADKKKRQILEGGGQQKKVKPLYKRKRTAEEEKFWRRYKYKLVKEKSVQEIDKNKKHRYEIIDQNLRLAECVICRKKGIRHGIRLFPPHLYDLRNGVLYYRPNKKSKFKRYA